MGVCGIDINDQNIVLTMGGCISIVCLAIIFYIYYFCNITNLRRHPTTIAIHKCWFEVIFVSQYLWMSFVGNSFFWDVTSDDIDSCQVNPSIWPFSWLTQFSLLGGELWFAVLSIDIHLSLTNPFSSHQANAIYYTGFVYSIAIIMACVLVSIVPIKYGLSTDPMIWVHDQKDKTNNIKVAMFYSYMSVIYLYCGCIAYWSRSQISKGLEDTLKIRQYSVSKTTIYVIGYFIFWTLVFAFQFLNYLKSDFDLNFMSNSDGDILRTVSAFLLASRGIWSLSIFVLANQREIFGHYKKQSDRNKSFGTTDGEANAADSNPPNEEQELLQLNIVLQKEIVRFTGLGIQKAARDMSIMMEAASSRSSLSSNLNFFGVKMPGESVSFVVVDPDIIKSRENSREPLRVNSVVPTYNDPVNPLLNSHTPAMTTHSPPKYISSSLQSIQPFRESDMDRNSFQQEHISGGGPGSLGTQPGSYGAGSNSLGTGAGSFGAAPQISPDYVEQSEERQKTVSQAEVNFQLENKQMERQFSDSSQKSEVTRASTIAKVIHTISNMGRKKRDNFLFTDYSPKRFARIRHLSGIEMADYMESFRATTMPSFSEGKSGAFIYFSCDYKYIVKTTVKSEFEKLLSILPDMEAYLEEEVKQWHKPLITRFFGAHRIIMYDIPLYFVVMQNVLPSVDEKYDLKGSWVNRHGSKKSSNPERQRPKKNNQTKEKGSTPLFLDNDLQNCFLIRPDVAKAVVKQIARDTRFLERFNLMDYSLLIGVRRRNFEILDSQTTQLKDLSAVNLQTLQGNPFSQDVDGAFHAAVVEGQGTFYIGIIDILQEWNWKKWVERMFKIIVLQKDGNGLSAIEPTAYRKRFVQRAVLDVIDGVDNMTVADFDEMIDRPTSPLQMSSPGSVRSALQRSSITRNQSERDTEAGEGMSKSFSTISREPSQYSVDHEFKYKGTDMRFSVTPMNVNKEP